MVRYCYEVKGNVFVLFFVCFSQMISRKIVRFYKALDIETSLALFCQIWA